jgi:hypothetical protein
MLENPVREAIREPEWERAMVRPSLSYLAIFFMIELVVSYASRIESTYGLAPGGTVTLADGYPLAWLTSTGTLCGSNPVQQLESYPVLNAPCFKSCCATSYNYFCFAIDVLFYSAVITLAYMILLGSQELVRDTGKPRPAPSDNQQEPASTEAE